MNPRNDPSSAPMAVSRAVRVELGLPERECLVRDRVRVPRLSGLSADGGSVREGCRRTGPRADCHAFECRDSAILRWVERAIQGRERDRCFQAFLNNNWAGFAVFLGLALDLALS